MGVCYVSLRELGTWVNTFVDTHGAEHLRSRQLCVF